MACIVKHKVGNYHYLYKSRSYRDENGKVKTEMQCVGKVDNLTGKHIFKNNLIESLVNEKLIDDSYLNELNNIQKADLIHINKDNTDNIDLNINNNNISRQLKYGATFLLDHIIEEIGLKQILISLFPLLWKQIISLSYYYVIENKSSEYCKFWLANSFSLFTTKELMLDNDKCESITNILSSQRISDLFMLIKQDDIINFYSTWKDKNDQNEFFALDITSVSSYSNLIQSVEYGYNRDRDNLRQINLCMLLGEKSWLPKFSFIYNGSLSDVSTLITTIEQLNGINFQQINLVLDKGFFSTKNIDFLLGNQNEPKFVIAVPFSNKFALDAVNKSANDNKNIDNVIQIGNDTVFSSSREFNWDKHKKIFVYTFYNPIIYENKRISLINDIYAMIDDVKNDPEKYKNIENYKKHLIIRRSKLYECGYSIKINKEVYEKELINKGWLVIISNTGYSASEIINIYRNKDVVEKGFDNLKNNLQLHRLNVHSEKTMESKIFVSLISLIIMLYINKIMSKNKLYKNYTLHSLLSTLDLIKAQVYNNKLIIMPVSKKQRDIYKFFNCPLPSNITF